MRAAVVRVRVNCPDWCTVAAEDHADLMREHGEGCDHRSAVTDIPDTQGYAGPGEQSRMHDPVKVQVCQSTSPDGYDQHTPVLLLNGDGISPQQALALADALTAAVALLPDSQTQLEVPIA